MDRSTFLDLRFLGGGGGLVLGCIVGLRSYVDRGVVWASDVVRPFSQPVEWCMRHATWHGRWYCKYQVELVGGWHGAL